MAFDDIEWGATQVLVNGITFDLEDCLKGRPGPAEFRLHRHQAIVDDYAEFFDRNPDAVPRRMMEIGIWQSGSMVFWNEVLHPERLTGIDIRSPGDLSAFERYLASGALCDRVRARWGVNQGDSEHLRAIVDADNLAPLDLVIDDASHEYDLTMRSFNALFPLLRPGGHYIIEDWNWEHSPNQQDPRDPITLLRSPERLVLEALQAMASVRRIVAAATIYTGFAAIRRGSAAIDHAFDIRSLIRPKKAPSLALRLRRPRRRLRVMAKRAIPWR